MKIPNSIYTDIYIHEFDLNSDYLVESLNIATDDEIAKLTAEKLNGISPGAFKTFNAHALNGLAAIHLPRLTADVFNFLPNFALKNLKAHVLNALSTDTLTNLQAHVLDGLLPETLGLLKVHVLDGLSPEAVPWLNADVLNHLSPATLWQLNPDLLNGLSETALGLLEARVLNDFSPTAVKWLNADVLNHLSAAALWELKAPVLNNLSPDARKKLHAPVLNGLSPDALMWLSAPVLKDLSSAALKELHADVLNGLSPPKRKTLHADVLHGLSPAALKELHADVLNGLSPPKRKTLRADVLNGLSPAALRALHADVLNDLSPNALSQLKSHVLKGLSCTALELLDTGVLHYISNEALEAFIDHALKGFPDEMPELHLARTISGHQDHPKNLNTLAALGLKTLPRLDLIAPEESFYEDLLEAESFYRSINEDLMQLKVRDFKSFFDIPSDFINIDNISDEQLKAVAALGVNAIHISSARMLNDLSETEIKQLDALTLNALPLQSLPLLNYNFITNLSEKTLKRLAFTTIERLSFILHASIINTLSNEAINDIDADFFNNYNSKDLEYFDARFFNNLAPGVLSDIILNDLPEETLISISAAAINGASFMEPRQLDLTVIKYLPDATIQQLEAHVFNNLSLDGFNDLNEIDSHTFSSRILYNISDEAYAELDNKLLDSFAEEVRQYDARALNLLRPEQLKLLEARAFNNLPVVNLKRLEAYVLNGLSPDALRELHADVLNGLSPDALWELEARVLKGLSCTALELLDALVLYHISNEALEAFIDHALKGFPDEMPELPLARTISGHQDHPKNLNTLAALGLKTLPRLKFIAPNESSYKVLLEAESLYRDLNKYLMQLKDRDFKSFFDIPSDFININNISNEQLKAVAALGLNAIHISSALMLNDLSETEIKQLDATTLNALSHQSISMLNENIITNLPKETIKKLAYPTIEHLSFILDASIINTLSEEAINNIKADFLDHYNSDDFKYFKARVFNNLAPRLLSDSILNYLPKKTLISISAAAINGALFREPRQLDLRVINNLPDTTIQQLEAHVFNSLSLDDLYEIYELNDPNNLDSHAVTSRILYNTSDEAYGELDNDFLDSFAEKVLQYDARALNLLLPEQLKLLDVRAFDNLPVVNLKRLKACVLNGLSDDAKKDLSIWPLLQLSDESFSGLDESIFTSFMQTITTATPPSRQHNPSGNNKRDAENSEQNKNIITKSTETILSFINGLGKTEGISKFDNRTTYDSSMENVSIESSVKESMKIKPSSPAYNEAFQKAYTEKLAKVEAGTAALESRLFAIVQKFVSYSPRP